MPDRPPFDPMRAAFVLIGVVIVTQLLIVLAGAAVCLIHADAIVSGTFKCDAAGHLHDLLNSALSAALGYAGGNMRKPSP